MLDEKIDAGTFVLDPTGDAVHDKTAPSAEQEDPAQRAARRAAIAKNVAAARAEQAYRHVEAKYFVPQCVGEHVLHGGESVIVANVEYSKKLTNEKLIAQATTEIQELVCDKVAFP